MFFTRESSATQFSGPRSFLYKSQSEPAPANRLPYTTEQNPKLRSSRNKVNCR
jgi:hypothetical protein